MLKTSEHMLIEESFYEESYNSTPFFQGIPLEKYRERLNEKMGYLEKNKLPLLAVKCGDELLGYIFISSNRVAELYLRNHNPKLMEKLQTSNLQYTLKENKGLIKTMDLNTVYDEKLELEGFKIVNLLMEKPISDGNESYGIEFKELSDSQMDKYFNLEKFKQDLVRDYLHEDPLLSEAEAVERFENSVVPLLKQDNQKMYGVCSADKVIGILWLMEKTPDISFIAYVEIFEEFRGQGFGKKVMYDMFSFINKLGYKALQLHVYGHNTKAVNLYEQTGFKNTFLRYRYISE